ncbi:hypothetical protein GO296_04878 [Ralstonia solanacearum]|nr:hypothetical protein [Ralstonia solanacearum]
MPVGLGVERIDVLAVFCGRLGQGLPARGQDLVLDPLHVGRTLGLGLAVTRGGVDAGARLVIDQLQRIGRGLLAQRRLLREGSDQQLGRLGDLHRLRLPRALQRRLLLLVARLDRLDLALQVCFDHGAESLVRLGHPGGGVVHRGARLGDRLLDLADPGFEFLQGRVDSLGAAADRLLRALAHRLQTLGDLLGGTGCRVHGALGRIRPPAGIGDHLREDPVHVAQPCLVPLGRLSDGVGGEDRSEHLPVKLQLLDGADQHLDHQDAGAAHGLELLRQPRADLPADEERAQGGEAGPEYAHARNGGRHLQVGSGPGGGGGARCRDGGGACGLPRGDQGWEQPVDEHGEANLGDACEPAHHHVEVLRYPRQCLGQLGGEAGGLVDPVDVLPEGIAQPLERLTDRRRQLGVFGGELVFLGQQRVDHHVGGQPALLRHLAQPADRDVQAIGQGLREPGAVLDHRVELLAAQHARRQGLAELQQGRLRLVGGRPGDAQRLRDALGDGERLLLLAAEHAHRLLELAVQRGRLLNRHADALGDVEQCRLRGRELALAGRRQLQARSHHVPGVGDLNGLLYLAGDPVDREEGEQLRSRCGDLLADDGHASLDLGDAHCGPVACGLG